MIMPIVTCTTDDPCDQKLVGVDAPLPSPYFWEVEGSVFCLYPLPRELVCCVVFLTCTNSCLHVSVWSS